MRPMQYHHLTQRDSNGLVRPDRGRLSELWADAPGVEAGRSAGQGEVLALAHGAPSSWQVQGMQGAADLEGHGWKACLVQAL
jgi:hypothetical protein